MLLDLLLRQSFTVLPCHDAGGGLGSGAQEMAEKAKSCVSLPLAEGGHLGITRKGEPENPAPLDQSARDAPASRVAQEPTEVCIFGESSRLGFGRVGWIVKMQFQFAHCGEDKATRFDQACGLRLLRKAYNAEFPRKGVVRCW